MLTKQEITDIIKNNISRIQKNYNVKRLGLFGSFIRGMERNGWGMASNLIHGSALFFGTNF